MTGGHEITQLLQAARTNRRDAFDEVFPLVYDELRRIAHGRLFKHRAGETLNTTALVHEAYLKLVDNTEVEWQDRAHFFALAARAMRFILVDYARARTAEKRGGGTPDLALDDVQLKAERRAADLLALDEALDRLAAMDERLSCVVEYRFFGGMTYDEIAAVTGHSESTIKRDWRRARAWLFQAMRDD